MRLDFRILVLFALVVAQIGLGVAQLASMPLSSMLWLADLANFIRPHLLFVSLGLLALGLVAARRATILGGIFVSVAASLPFFTLPQPAQHRTGQTITVLSANVLIHNIDASRFLADDALAGADILVLQEVADTWQRQLTASKNWTFESSRDLEANTDMKVFSRYPVLSEETVAPLSGDTAGRHAVRLELDVEGKSVVVYAVHASTPRSPRGWHARNAYLRDLNQAIAGEAKDASVIVAGDWNTPTWSPFFRDFLDETGYLATGSRWWPAPTRFPSRLGLTSIGTPIDHIVVSPNIGLRDLTIGRDFGSNHLPVIATLTLP